MPVYHIVLFKLKPNINKAQLSEWSELGAAMVGKIPGLLKWDANPPLPVTAYRAQGYDMGLIAVLEKPEDVVNYGKHPAHQRVHEMREAFCSQTLAYDFEF
ncbi:stress responsive a b barrel domain [Trichoderma arundinaceum]|uniref:Stress responsive a b barrel domain n=1 Tax=Trichoderma arundinaceum TaxID=490622 RepID=A0A395NBF7_TRIAR|nr:stress responsive a b barrel domain [Trichoderma arundinaceum]